MNARFTLKHAVLLALVAILIALNIVDVSSPVQAASSIGQTVSPTIVPTHYAGERTPETGIVSITCRNRNHFEYHNEDKTQCGDAVAVGIEKDSDDSTSINKPYTPVIIDDGGVSIPSDDGSSNGGTTTTQHTNNGNHYGNDKPDNNAKDVKNQHNGENTSAEHHDEPKGKSK